MSQTTSIDFEVSQSLNAVELLKQLEYRGWTATNNDQIVYLPLGDDGMYDWRTTNSKDAELVFNELQKKAVLNESIGLVLIDKNSGCGGELLIWPDYTSFSLTLSVKLNELREPEYYVKRIKDSIASLGLEITSTEIGII